MDFSTALLLGCLPLHLSLLLRQFQFIKASTNVFTPSVSERNHRAFWKKKTNPIVFYFSPHDTQWVPSKCHREKKETTEHFGKKTNHIVFYFSPHDTQWVPSKCHREKKERKRERRKEIHQFAMPSATGITRIRPTLALPPT